MKRGEGGGEGKANANEKKKMWSRDFPQPGSVTRHLSGKKPVRNKGTVGSAIKKGEGRRSKGAISPLSRHRRTITQRTWYVDLVPRLDAGFAPRDALTSSTGNRRRKGKERGGKERLKNSALASPKPSESPRTATTVVTVLK